MIPITRVNVKKLLRSRTFQTTVSIVLGVGLLAFFLSRVPLADIGRQIAAISAPWLLAAIALSLFVFVVRTTRWIWILRPVGEVPVLPGLSGDGDRFRRQHRAAGPRR